MILPSRVDDAYLMYKDGRVYSRTVQACGIFMHSNEAVIHFEKTGLY